MGTNGSDSSHRGVPSRGVASRGVASRGVASRSGPTATWDNFSFDDDVVGVNFYPKDSNNNSNSFNNYDNLYNSYNNNHSNSFGSATVTYQMDNYDKGNLDNLT